MFSSKFYGVAAIVAVIGIASLIFAPGMSVSDDAKGGHSQHGELYGKCAKACAECQLVCDDCARHCAGALHEGKKEHYATLQATEDCATICAAASRIVSRGGPSSARICMVCAEVCASCAKECERFPDDKHMAACAVECRACEKACASMVKSLSHQ